MPTVVLLGEKAVPFSVYTIKVLEDNIGRKISDIPCSNIFTDMAPKQETYRKE